MKTIFKKILQYYLKYITKLVLFIHRPVIIAVSGSTNKTFVKDEIKKIIREKGLSVRANPKNFNTEIGLPLAVLDLPSGYNSFRNWLPIIWKSFFCVFQTSFPKYLVLELGVSRKGNMKYLLSVAKPNISVITDITQRYLESFSGMDDLAGEYKILLEKTKRDGLAILNFDNSRIRRIAKNNHAVPKIVSLGENEGCDWKISDIKRLEKGESFAVTYKNVEKRFEIGRYGRHHIHAKIIGMIIEENLKIV